MQNQKRTNPRNIEREARTIANIIGLAGGELVGRTRLQKIVYLLTATDLLRGFEFEYRHYGPYSDDLSIAMSIGRLEGIIEEEERQASWGGTYSVYRVSGKDVPKLEKQNKAFKQLLDLMASANPIALELAATAAYLAQEGSRNAWRETLSRKPEKSSQIEAAKALYRKLAEVPTPKRLPRLIATES